MCQTAVCGKTSRISVLLVDSHADFRRIATRFLEQDQDIVVVGLLAIDGDLLQTVRQVNPKIVLLDLGISAPSRLETIRQLRRAIPQSRVIALTLFDAEGYREAVLAAGADDFIIKDALHHALLPAIHRVATTPSGLVPPPS